MMRVVTIVYLLALTLWIGGVIGIGAVAAPVAFDVAPSRTVAGAIVGGALARLDYILFACLGALIVTTGLKTWREDANKVMRWARLTGLALMTAGLVWSVMMVKPRMADLQERIGSFDARASSPARAEFAELHERSKQAMSITLVGAFILLCAY